MPFSRCVDQSDAVFREYNDLVFDETPSDPPVLVLICHQLSLVSCSLSLQERVRDVVLAQLEPQRIGIAFYVNRDCTSRDMDSFIRFC